MASKIDLAPLPQLDPLSEPSSLSQHWKSWKKRFQTYVAALDIKEDKQKRALLLYQAGKATQEIFETLEGTGEDYKTAKEKLDEYFSPKKNVDYEIFQFCKATQEPGETVDQFVTRLRKLAATCEFHDASRELKSAVIQNCLSKRLRRYALRKDTLKLDELLAKARSLEASETQATGIEKNLPSEEVNRLLHKPQQSKPPVKKPQRQLTQSRSNTCRQCGLIWPHRTKPCPAKGQSCNKCGKPNHFAKMCHTKVTTRTRNTQQRRTQEGVNQVSSELPADEPESSSDDEYLYALNQNRTRSSIPQVTVHINKISVDMIVDTGASIDILDEDTYNKVNHDNTLTLQPSTKRLFAYGSISQLNVLGCFTTNITVKASKKAVTFHVLEGNHGSLLIYTTARDLGILDIQVNQVKDVTTHDRLCTQYPSLFTGIGQLKGVQVKLHIDSTVPPVAQKARRIPLHLHKKVEPRTKQSSTTKHHRESRGSNAMGITTCSDSKKKW